MDAHAINVVTKTSICISRLKLCLWSMDAKVEPANKPSAKCLLNSDNKAHRRYGW